MAGAFGGFQLPPSPPESGGDSDNNTFSEASSSSDKTKSNDKETSKGNREVKNGRGRKCSSVQSKKDSVKRASDEPKRNHLTKKARAEQPKENEGDTEKATCSAAENTRSRRSSSRRSLTPRRNDSDEKDEMNESDEKDEMNESDENEENKDYEVESILDYWVENGTETYLIKWLNWASKHNTWEEASNLNNCEGVLTSFFLQRSQEVVECKSFLRKNPRQLTTTLKNLPCPPDPRSLNERIQIFFDANRWSLPSDEELLTAFKGNKTALKETEWPRNKVDKYLKDQILGDFNLKRDSLQAFKSHLVTLLAEDKYLQVQASLKGWEEYLNSITMGMPSLTVINEIDFTGPTKDFVYVNEYVAGKGVVIPNDPPIGCSCEGSCIRNKKGCCPSNNEVRFSYSASKRVMVGPGNAIYECNSNCKCDASCINRVVQNGTSALKGTKFCIFKTEDKGWGVKTLQTIKKGQFVAVYAGEVILSKEAEERGKLYDREGLTYLFDLDFNDEDNQFTVDAKKMGNFSHFFNHSCDPNLVIYNVYVNCLDPNLPILALFASRDIIKGEELCFDYKSKNEQDGNNNYACHCKSENCRKFFL